MVQQADGKANVSEHAQGEGEAGTQEQQEGKFPASHVVDGIDGRVEPGKELVVLVVLVVLVMMVAIVVVVATITVVPVSAIGDLTLCTSLGLVASMPHGAGHAVELVLCGLPLARKPVLALPIGLHGAITLEGGNHEMSIGILQEVDGERRNTHGLVCDLLDDEGNGDQVETAVVMYRSRGIEGGIAGNAQAERVLRSILGDVEELRGTRCAFEGARVDLDAVEEKSLGVRANFEAEELCSLV